MTVRRSALALVHPRLIVGGRRAAGATSILVQDRPDLAAHLTYLIEPTHRITHGEPLSDVDERSRAATAERTWHSHLHVDQKTCSCPCNGTVGP